VLDIYVTTERKVCRMKLISTRPGRSPAEMAPAGSFRSRSKHLGAIVALTFVATGLVSTPVSAAQPAPQDPAVDHVDISVKEETWNDKRQKLATVYYGPESEGQTLGGPAPSDGGVTAQSSGSGGTSTASGCRKSTLTHTAKNAAGYTLYVYSIWTRWCWTRSNQVVYDVTTGRSATGSAYVEWKGDTTDERLFYDYGTNDGHPRSAYKHYRIGHFYYTISPGRHYYPDLLFRSYYNGTYAWAENG
jgi:hypothetical protein